MHNNIPQSFSVGNPETHIGLLPTQSVPALNQNAGPYVTERLLEFFTAHVRNAGTRMAYADAVGRFCKSCETRNLSMQAVSPIVIANYI